MTSDEIRTLIEKKLPPAPNNITEWIYQECVQKAYLIYSKNKVICTRCGTEQTIPSGSWAGLHGQEYCCPCCGAEATVLSAGRGRKKYRETFRIVIYVSRGKTVWASYWWIDADFTPFGQPELRRCLKAIYRLNSKHQDYFKHEVNYWSGNEYWEQVKEVKIPNVPRGMYFGWYREPAYEPLYVYPYNLNKVFRNTDAKYLVYGDHLRKINGSPQNFHRYLALGLKYKSIELLMKSGFDNLANSKIIGHGSGAINIRGDNLRKILRLPDRWIKKLRPWNPSNMELKTFQALTEEEKAVITRELLKDMREYYSPGSYNDSLEAKLIKYRAGIEEYAPFLKWLKYIINQSWAQEEKRYRSNIRGDYLDYIGTCEKLGMDITKKKILYPEDLKTAHDEVMKRYKAEENKIRDAAITMNARRIDYRIGNLMIVPALTQEDLNQESAKLCHCVKTYGPKLEKGECWIFFIRHADDPNEPYYTMETDISGKLIQCRGKSNCSMTDEIKQFTDSFITTLSKEVKRERKEKGLLCQTA